MEDYEYKVVPAPVRTVKVKGLKTTGERFAHLMTEALNREAETGWEFLRAETLPCEERKGLMSKSRSTQTVLIFRRPLYLPEEPATGPAPMPQQAEPARHPVPSFRSEPKMSQSASTGEEAWSRREPALRAPRQRDEDR